MSIKFKKITILIILCFMLVNSAACTKTLDKTEILLEDQEVTKAEEQLYIDLTTNKLSIINIRFAELVEILNEQTLTAEAEKKAKELVKEIKVTAQSYLDIKKSDIPIKYEIADIYMNRAMENYIEAMDTQPLKKEDMTIDSLVKSSQCIEEGNKNLRKFLEEVNEVNKSGSK